MVIRPLVRLAADEQGSSSTTVHHTGLFTRLISHWCAKARMK